MINNISVLLPINGDFHVSHTIQSLLSLCNSPPLVLNHRYHHIPVSVMYTVLFLSCLLVTSLAGPAQSIGSIGACLSGMCPAGYDCISDSCVVRRTKRAAICEKDKILGECLAGLCPDGFSCDGENCC
ncbi:hypothetical protein PRIPAC_70523 [Pristionchus pacificus]|uniref:Uncharacterized protein n=1 Tax=Pristionchus pacificus TaxID=54126 RepID=A0A2A6CAH7_PRIPA|nr:hypothetical protein PRIPAC_70523 [Pristionchus pacificus]|eukprot:PDM75031.1 hypothetical protein PRIPAC_40412 [Pristionchus pacificus]